MKVAIFGANGRTGRHIVTMALQKEYEVTAFVREKSNDWINHANLHFVKGDVLHAEDVKRAVYNQDAVVSCLGITNKSNKLICSEGVQQILYAMGKYQVKRFISISEASVSESLEKVSKFSRAFIRLILDKTAIKDKEAMEAAIKSSGLDWTIVRPPFLTNGPLKKQYCIGDSSNLKITSSISRADLADFIVNQLNTSQMIRKAVAIHY